MQVGFGFVQYLSMSCLLCFFAGAAHSLGGAKQRADKMSEKVRHLWAGSVCKSKSTVQQLSEVCLFWFCRGCAGRLWSWTSI